jgi:CheY-like chemotaxis protein
MSNLKNKKFFEVLAVDDDSFILEIVSVACRPFDLKASIYTASSVHNAIDMCEKRKFDLVCLDHDLEGVKGWELMDYLQPLLPKDVKVLIYSSKVDEESKKEYQSRGVTEILKKPLTPTALGFAIRKALAI